MAPLKICSYGIAIADDWMLSSDIFACQDVSVRQFRSFPLSPPGYVKGM
jgi:hypothetical protein